MNQTKSNRLAAGFLLTLLGLISFMASANAAEWEKTKLKGDLRYRHEMKDVDGVDDTRHRQRIRGRVGLWGPINDKVDFGFRIATGGTANTSTNQTLDDAAANKAIGLDLFYMTWRAMDELKMTAGKMNNPLYMPAKNPMLWDSDVTPEGLAFNYNRDLGSLSTFVNLAGFWHQENSTGTDEGVVAAQLGFVFPVGKNKITLGASNNTFANIKGATPVNGALGNTLNGTTYANEYVVTEFFLELKGKLGGVPVTLGGSVFSNSEASTNDMGHWAAVIVGDLKSDKWSVKVGNFKIEADATLGEYADSDALGGGTDGQGTVIGASYALADNVQADLTYWMSETGISGTSTDVQLGQLDFLFKF